ncbi:MAG TPA: nucleoside monophosphate kinase [Tepidisphaeraceae bacterium]|jgi:adenylate kinase|nr:nucleoside monophosphate kinase [Tepidisphaeraceae bacterium]
MPYRTVLLFGPPGSGKGTQGKILGAMPAFFHCACGDVFRSLDPKSEMGVEFANYSKAGSLVPDELTVKLWRAGIERAAASGQYKPADQYLLLDGIPRTIQQAELMAGDLDVRAVINLYCNDVSQIVARLSKRAILENRADDTDIEVIRHRIDVYEEQTEPLLNFYTRGKIYRVNATRPPEIVTADVLKVIDAVRRDW